MDKTPLTIKLAAPRGFCAGVDRAIQIVERALERFGAPVYVRHEIVHNRYVVDALRAKGAVFIEELDEIPENHAERPVVFSAHGAPRAVHDEARRRNMFAIDATCPLVTKVHYETQRHDAQGRQIVLVGHAGHPEVSGTMGQLPPGAVLLVESVEDVARLAVRDPGNLAYATQTTLSVDDTAQVVEALKVRFPGIVGPGREDICYATTNRQEAVKAIAPHVDALLVIGAPNSSNSNRLVEVARNYGCPRARLIQRAADIDWAWLAAVRTLGLTAGASAPDVLVDEVVEAFRARFAVTLETVTIREENVTFRLPRALEVA
ncbi:MAG: 4-hydroxy-3-methylbut-2-enyl diphosphate reductase [Rhodospirillales bacterium]|nr:4-hydroxy-3-methylbut-2-enyl diphosphate reductase [Rhodospirillales bacterium]USO08639.1 MAG: 4-hydroxy-3-methylbut-2-enyl diphosphate reductase [Rhodospirillales bacterium]